MPPQKAMQHSSANKAPITIAAAVMLLPVFKNAMPRAGGAWYLGGP